MSVYIYPVPLEEKSQARQIYEEQMRNKWRGLATETATICQELKIQDCNITTMNISRYKQLVNNALHNENEDRLQLLGQGKCAKIMKEDYGKKEYISSTNIKTVQERYRTRFGLLPFAGNYSHDRQFASTNWLCRCKQTREEECHFSQENVRFSVI